MPFETVNSIIIKIDVPLQKTLDNLYLFFWDVVISIRRLRSLSVIFRGSSFRFLFISENPIQLNKRCKANERLCTIEWNRLEDEGPTEASKRMKCNLKSQQWPKTTNESANNRQQSSRCCLLEWISRMVNACNLIRRFQFRWWLVVWGLSRRDRSLSQPNGHNEVQSCGAENAHSSLLFHIRFNVNCRLASTFDRDAWTTIGQLATLSCDDLEATFRIRFGAIPKRMTWFHSNRQQMINQQFFLHQRLFHWISYRFDSIQMKFASH